MESNNASETQEKKTPRNKTKDIDQANAKGSIESLPQEIMLYIFSKLPVSSMPQFKCVNKDWCRISRNPNPIDVCKDRSDEMNQCLIFQSDHLVKNKIYMAEFDALYNDEDTTVMRFRSMFPFLMLEIEVNCSFNGLLCGNPYDYFVDSRSAQVLIDGRLHWVNMPNRHIRSRKIISFDLDDEKFRVVPKPRALVLGFSDYELFSFNGCLSAVLCGNNPNGTLEVWVMKEYAVKHYWVKDFTIASYLPKALELNGKDYFDDSEAMEKNTATVSKIVQNRDIKCVVCVLRNEES
ncbi:hypothetical protein TIFTF001_001825 [Ficus carica]|uniref:F-box domain-containing protein n=1 Tax=Ficus carica TaxID=3494 RepID=A0AA87ZQL8_FICCA|nr:hypothetical protein TIFTF001_001825 [Ficus carica]